MFYPFSLTALSRDRRETSRVRPLESRDLTLAQEWCQTHLPRFPAYQRQVLEGQLTALLIGAAVPGIGHLAFGWPLQLLAISLVADCVAALWADRLRDRYAEHAFLAAMRAALHGEQTMATAAALGRGGRPGNGRVPDTPYEDYAGNLNIMLLPCLAIGALSFNWLLPRIGILPLLAALFVPFAARLLQACVDIRRSRTTVDVDLHFLPQSLAPLACTALAIFIALILHPLSMLLPVDLDAQARWFGYAAAVAYLAVCAVFALLWRKRLAQAQATLAAFAAEPLQRNEQRLRLKQLW